MSHQMPRDISSDLKELVSRLRRYRLVILLGKPSSGKSQVAIEASNLLQARYLNVNSEILSELAKPGFFPTLGAYGPEDFIGWILELSNEPGGAILIVDQIEPLLATFGRTKTMQFFQMLSQIEPKIAVVIVTFLAKQVEQSSFPEERLLTL